MLKKPSNLRTWIEIDISALKKNYQAFRRLIGQKSLLMAVVKSNAYGHGLIDFSLAVQKLGIDWLGVDSTSEALNLRKVGIKKPILVFGHTLPENLISAATKNISLTVSAWETLNCLQKLKKNAQPVKIHLKIDTGMHRQGFFVKDLPRVLLLIKKNRKIILEGVYTHFAAAKNPAFPNQTLGQIKEFQKALKIINYFGFNPIRHAAATAGALLFPEARFDLTRIGIGLYGYWPSQEIKNHFKSKIKLFPILAWKTVIGERKKLSRGGGIGYGFSERVKPGTIIAVCPIGYWHGFPRSLSCLGSVLIRGKRAKILGRVSMDMIVADATKIKKARVGDEVIIIGQSGGEEITAEEIACQAQTTSYEILTRINPLIKKFYY
ncbi:MAG: alanine racemase [Candidatus Magasanikbacteria bacterium]|nr:alanine racemase [Candidatus Magasanikbacteria bacterium]